MVTTINLLGGAYRTGLHPAGVQGSVRCMLAPKGYLQRRAHGHLENFGFRRDVKRTL